MATVQRHETGTGVRAWSRKRWLVVGALALAVIVAAVLIVVYSGGGGSGVGGGY
jgi:hypothetical protein